MICDEAKIPEEHRGVGKPQDVACHIWNDESKGHLVRICGGRKIDKEGNLKGYKTLIDRVPETKAPVMRFSDVAYPSGNDVKVWTIPEPVFEIFIEAFNQPRKREIKNVMPQGTYLNAPCALSLRLNGAPASKRSLGAAVLAHWCVLDNIDRDEALSIGEAYYEKCDQDEFDISEVVAWINFAYNKFHPITDPKDAKGLIVKNCMHARQLDMCDQAQCQVYNKMYPRPAREIPKHTAVNMPKFPHQLSPHFQAPKHKWKQRKKAMKYGKAVNY
jgi:hypothetical protein